MISIIVPIYKGRKYIQKMIEQIEACSSFVSESVELVIINDFPGEEIGTYISHYIDIQVIETDVNRGIHGARVEGLKYANGEYICFLDQDDEVHNMFLKKQMEHIYGDNLDVVVCGASREGKSVYDKEVSLQEVVSADCMFGRGNFIVSPGQVLMKKDSIPQKWKDNILKVNGVDDWFLWLCMMDEGYKFGVNDEVMYNHVDEGGNASANTCVMFESANEMLSHISTNRLFDDVKIKILKDCIFLWQKEQIKLLDKFKRMFFLYDEWMLLNFKGKGVSSYLQKIGVRKVCIYGLGYIGKQLVAEISASNIEIVYCVDKNASFIFSQQEVAANIDVTKDVDLYIVTILDGAEELCNLIECDTGISAKPFALLLKEAVGEVYE